MKQSVLLVLISSLISGLLGVGISTYYHQRSELRSIKIETLKSIVAYRWALSPHKVSHSVNDQFFGALNAAFVVFNDAPEVLKSLETFHTDLNNLPEKGNDNLVRLIKAMCDDVGIQYKSFNDAFIMRPFAPAEDSLSNN